MTVAFSCFNSESLFWPCNRVPVVNHMDHHICLFWAFASPVAVSHMGYHSFKYFIAFVLYNDYLYFHKRCYYHYAGTIITFLVWQCCWAFILADVEHEQLKLTALLRLNRSCLKIVITVWKVYRSADARMDPMCALFTTASAIRWQWISHPVSSSG